MRVFVTGATGFVGEAVVAELVGAGHDVIGLARSDASEAALTEAGAQAARGDLTDLDGLRSAAESSDGIIHLAFRHDFDDFAAAAELDRAAITALGETLAGSGRALVVASGIAGITPGRILTEDQVAPPEILRASEEAAFAFANRGVRASAVRLAPTVHDVGDHGFVPRIIQVARDKGVSGYPGDGANRWPAVHRADAALAFRLAVEQAPAGGILHAVAEPGIPVRQIAEIIGRHLDVPVSSVDPASVIEHFGWIGAFFSIDMPASSALTQQRYGWQPTHAGLLDDLAAGHYFNRREN